MHPQTNAELIAYNLGAELQRSDLPIPQSWLTQAGERNVALTPARAEARDVLGPELFWEWAQRGYDAATIGLA